MKNLGVKGELELRFEDLDIGDGVKGEVWLDVENGMETLSISEKPRRNYGNEYEYEDPGTQSMVKGMESRLVNSEGMTDLVYEGGLVRDRTTSMDKGEESEKPGTRRVSARYLKGLRQKKWEEHQGWKKDDLDRILESQEALPEQIQDYESPMVLIGSDVESLYPNLEVNKVVEGVKEAILGSKMEWEEIDYLEGVRYLALNWTQEQCNRSRLRRVLPVRRGKRGSRPGLKGAGPQGARRGDQEQ